MWLDLRSLQDFEVTQNQAQLLASVIAHYSASPELMAKAFPKYKDYLEFLPLAKALSLNQKIEFDKIKAEV